MEGKEMEKGIEIDYPKDKKMTIQKAVEKIVSDLPANYVFSGLWLAQRVRELREDKTMDGSATKILRASRQEGKLNYEVVNRKKSLYRKLKLPVYSEPIYREEKGGQLVMI